MESTSIYTLNRNIWEGSLSRVLGRGIGRHDHTTAAAPWLSDKCDTVGADSPHVVRPERYLLGRVYCGCYGQPLNFHLSANTEGHYEGEQMLSWDPENKEQTQCEFYSKVMFYVIIPMVSGSLTGSLELFPLIMHILVGYRPQMTVKCVSFISILHKYF